MIQPSVNVDMRRGVDEGPSIAAKLRVITFAGEELGNLLHVSNPVDLGICRRFCSAGGSAWRETASSHGTFQITRPQSSASASRSAGGTSLEIK